LTPPILRPTIPAVATGSRADPSDGVTLALAAIEPAADAEPDAVAPASQAPESPVPAPVEPARRRWHRPHRRILVIMVVVLSAALGGGIWLAANQLRPADPIAKAAQTFAGHPRQADIRSRLNIAFAIYGLEETDENYSKAAAALTLLRESAVADGFPQLTEMDILEGMIADGGLPGSTFPEAAGYSAFGLRIFPN
jgi:hypothetical protein